MDDGIEVSIAAVPKNGEANEELIEYMSDVLGIKKKELSLDKGGKSRSKVLEISSSDLTTPEEVYDILKSSQSQ